MCNQVILMRINKLTYKEPAHFFSQILKPKKTNQEYRKTTKFIGGKIINLCNHSIFEG